MGDNDLLIRCPTGIEGFDAICQGGLVRNSSNVLVGGAGSGKTTFMLQFLWNGVQKYNENGMYCSFEPDIVETLKDAASYGWNFVGPNREEKIKFLKFSPKTKLDDLKSELTKIVTKYRIQRICFDPVTVLTLQGEHQGKIRETIYEIASLMKRLRVTSILADESVEDTTIYQEKTSWSETDILKFLTDGVIVFNQTSVSQDADRSMQITKMRRTDHMRTPVGMKITPHGVEIFAPKELLARLREPNPVPQELIAQTNLQEQQPIMKEEPSKPMLQTIPAPNPRAQMNTQTTRQIMTPQQVPNQTVSTKVMPSQIPPTKNPFLTR
jgi:KaiC/GvpD/RAD55 family RecA-like ATPase